MTRYGMRIISSFLIFLLLFSSCAQQQYSIHSLQRKPLVHKKLINRIVLISKTDGTKIKGYLKSVNTDSVKIIHINHKDEMSEKSIAANEIKSVQIYKKQNPLVGLGIVSFSAFVVLFYAGFFYPDFGLR